MWAFSMLIHSLKTSLIHIVFWQQVQYYRNLVRGCEVSRLQGVGLGFEVENKDKITLSKDVQLIDYTSQVPDSAKRPIDEVAANLREDYKETVKYYTIAENNPYNFFVSLNLLGEEGIGIEGKATKAAIVFIIKDNTIIYYTQDFNLSTNDYIIYNLSGYDEIKLPDFDYIGFLKRGDFESDTMILIENPFK